MKKEEAPLTVAVLHYIFQPVIFKGCVQKSSLKSSTLTQSSRGLGVHKWRRKRRPWPWLSSSASLACAHSNLGCPDPRANFKIQIHKLHKYKSAIQYKYKNKNTLFNAKLVTNTPVFGVFRGTKNMTMERNGNYGRRGCDTHWWTRWPYHNDDHDRDDKSW